MDGDWSPWSEWEGSCQLVEDCAVFSSQLAMIRSDLPAVQRVIPKRRRTRVCNNPAPLNGGAACQDGVSEQFRPCEHGCKLDGAWSQWTPWSLDCNTQCQRHRNRECAAPAPANGGNVCQGVDVQWRNCTADSDQARAENSKFPQLPVPVHCLQPRNSVFSLPAGKSSGLGESHQRLPATLAPFFDSKLFIFSSLGCLSFLLLIIAVLVAALFCRRRQKSSPSFGGIFMDSDGKGAKIYFPGENDGKTIQNRHKNSIIPRFLELDRVRTVLMSEHRRAFFGGCCLNSVSCNGTMTKQHYLSSATPPGLFVLNNGQDPSALVPAVEIYPSNPTPPAACSDSIMATVFPNSYTLRSARSWNSNVCEGESSGGCATERRISRTKGSRPFGGTKFAAYTDSCAALIPACSSYSGGSSSNDSASGSTTSRGERKQMPSSEQHHAKRLADVGMGSRSSSVRPVLRTAGTTETMLTADDNYATLYDYISCDTSSGAGTALIGSNLALEYHNTAFPKAGETKTTTSLKEWAYKRGQAGDSMNETDDAFGDGGPPVASTAVTLGSVAHPQLKNPWKSDRPTIVAAEVDSASSRIEV